VVACKALFRLEGLDTAGSAARARRPPVSGDALQITPAARGRGVPAVAPAPAGRTTCRRPAQAAAVRRLAADAGEGSEPGYYAFNDLHRADGAAVPPATSARAEPQLARCAERAMDPADDAPARQPH
jgi:hypothetical protein